jgi:ABC-2 type transport system ATP-binding protein
VWRGDAGIAMTAITARPPLTGVDPVVVRDLRMSYGDVEVLRGLDLSLQRGETLAVLGPNGAGKTTAIEILEGFRRRTSGSVSVLGVDPQDGGRDWRARIGVVLQSSATELELTARERLCLYAGYYPHPLDPDAVLRQIGLTDQAYVRCGRLSGGQLRRLDVGLALVGDPELLFLDEPTTGFDPVARRAAWDLIAQLRAGGMAIVLTTHQLEEAEFLADRIAVIVDGQVRATGTPPELIREHRSWHRHTVVVQCRLEPSVQTRQLPPEPLADVRYRPEDGQLTLRTDEPMAVLVALDRWSAEQAVTITELQVRQPSLEDVYLALITDTATGAAR